MNYKRYYFQRDLLIFANMNFKSTNKCPHQTISNEYFINFGHNLHIHFLITAVPSGRRMLHVGHLFTSAHIARTFRQFIYMPISPILYELVEEHCIQFPYLSDINHFIWIFDQHSYSLSYYSRTLWQTDSSCWTLVSHLPRCNCPVPSTLHLVPTALIQYS